MKSHTKYLTLTVPGKMTFVNITPEVAQAVRDSGVQEGRQGVQKARHGDQHQEDDQGAINASLRRSNGHFRGQA